MKRGLTFLIVTTCTIFVLPFGVRGNAQQPPAAASRPAAATHQAVLSKYCYTCHNDKVKSGGLALTTLDISAPAKHSEAWERVVRKLETGAMPQRDGARTRRRPTAWRDIWRISTVRRWPIPIRDPQGCSV